MLTLPRFMASSRAAIVLFGLVVTMAFVELSSPVRAEEPAAPSLELVPQDADFYSATLRLGEQIEIVTGSNWWKQLNEWDLVQQAKFMIQFGLQQAGGPGGAIMQALQQPENQELLTLLREMGSVEMFAYADGNATGSVALAIEAGNSARYAPMFYQVLGKDSELSQEEFQAKMALDTLAADLDAVVVPNFVAGFRITNKEAAQKQLKRLETLVQGLLEQEEDLAPFKETFQRTKVGEHEFLTLSLEGSMVPWDQVPFDRLEEKAGEYDALKKKLSELTLVVALGIRGDYVLLTIGPSTEHLAKLGQGESLASHPKLEPLRAMGVQRYTSLAYVSDSFMKAISTKPEDIDHLVDAAKQLLPQADLPSGMEPKLLADIEELAKDLKPFIPEAGSQLIFTYLTDRGIEGYRYNWSENLALDGAKRLSLIEHLGGSPLLAIVARGQQRPGDYDLLVKWLTKGRNYLEEFGVPQMSAEDKANYEKITKVAVPLFKRLDKVNRESLIPALQDGQCAFAVDASLTSTEWFSQLPATTEPVAIPSPALVLGVSDAKLFKKALGDYREILNDVIKEARKADPEGDIPDIQLPPAKVRSLEDGTEVFYYTLPSELGVHKRIAPNIAINEKLAVMSLVPRHTLELVKAQPLAVDGGPLANAGSRKLAAAAYFNWEATVDVLVPWVNEGIRTYYRQIGQIQGQFGLPGNGQLQVQGQPDMETEIIKRIKKGAGFLKALRGFSSIAYVEDGAIVTHSETQFKDLD